MRKSREEAAQTRKRIVMAAAGEFRKNGVVATGLNDLMSAAGLTHGGFYKHFESKDQLVAEACAEAVETDGFLRLVEIMSGQFARIPPDVARRRALVAVSTMVGALTMSRIVTDPELSAEILKEAEKSLADG